MTQISSSNPLLTIDKISKQALTVISTLHQSGFSAYLVGGGVRDMLLGLLPKDFDIATDATPDEVKSLFRNCRLIGRRFRLAHILFGREIIEVATFRANHEEDSHSSHHKPIDYRQHSGHTKDGMIVRDNVYGDIEEDAQRRDFSINGLYFEPYSHTLIDYANGHSDIENKTIRVIGDPLQRFQEDPVRMLRAVRFSAKLDFNIESQAKKLVQSQGHLLHKISPARLFDESLKLLQGGYGVKCFHALQENHLFSYLFPSVQKLIEQKHETISPFILQALKNTDQRIGIGKTVNPAFIVSVLLWYPMLKLKSKLLADNQENEFQTLLLASQEVLKQQQSYTAIPKRLGFMIKDIWLMQSRLEKPTKKNAPVVLAHKRFRATYDFLELRIKMGETQHQNIFNWWTEIQEVDEGEQQQMMQKLPSNSSKNKRKKRFIKK
ncbi:MAG: polynucleotide adenylyltransferase PcnB [Gammaproteobacteria bacterium]|nr:polynucleotide adenylyltransferase PcnB [Gammaproteobacteria bacterium]